MKNLKLNFVVKKSVKFVTDVAQACLKSKLIMVIQQNAKFTIHF